MTRRNRNVAAAGAVGRRGFVLVLVLIAVAVALILASVFLCTQGAAAQISSNISARNQAQMIAESGLEMTIAYLLSGDDWRTDKSEGLWVQDHAFLGGTFTVSVLDGTYQGGGVSGDGDLSDDSADPVTVASTGSYGGALYTVQAVVEIPRDWGRHIQLAGNLLRVGHNSFIDSFNSGSGPVGSGARISINTTQDDAVTIEGNGRITGDVFVGPGGDPDEVISDPSRVTGATGAQQETFDMPTVTEPAGMGPSQGDQEITSGSISGNLHYDNLTIKTGNIWVDGHVTILVENDFLLTDGAHLKFSAGASLDLYVKGQCTLDNKDKLGTVDNDPTIIHIYLLGSATMVVDGNATKVYATITAPQASLIVQNDAEVFGTFIGQNMELVGKGRFHQDVKNLYGDGRCRWGAVTVRWCEQP